MTDWKTIDDAVRVKPGAKVKIAGIDTVGATLFEDKKDAEKLVAEHARAINALQDRLFAERKRALLVVLQGIDTSGKDGTVRGVFNEAGPLGVNVTPFGKPTEEELAHDYLWRVHAAMPKKGFIGIFNRSHYEDVLVVKVRQFAPAEAIEKRYDQINAFEKHLVENGVTILKFMLHISKEEQAERLKERVEDDTKRWKFNPGDLDDRALWDKYAEAYEVMLNRCSTAHAPWHVVPADRNWVRNGIISGIVRETLEEMNPQYPQPKDWDPKTIRIV